MWLQVAIYTLHNCMHEPVCLCPLSLQSVFKEYCQQKQSAFLVPQIKNCPSPLVADSMSFLQWTSAAVGPSLTSISGWDFFLLLLKKCWSTFSSSMMNWTCQPEESHTFCSTRTTPNRSLPMKYGGTATLFHCLSQKGLSLGLLYQLLAE